MFSEIIPIERHSKRHAPRFSRTPDFFYSSIFDSSPFDYVANLSLANLVMIFCIARYCLNYVHSPRGRRNGQESAQTLHSLFLSHFTFPFPFSQTRTILTVIIRINYTTQILGTFTTHLIKNWVILSEFLIWTTFSLRFLWSRTQEIWLVGETWICINIVRVAAFLWQITSYATTGNVA